MISWADNAGTAMCKLLSDYSSERDENIRLFYLSELTVAISGLQAVTEELMEREKSLLY